MRPDPSRPLPPAADAVAPASLPPDGLPGLDPAWSRLVVVPESPAVGERGWGSETHAEGDPRSSERRVPPTPSDGGERAAAAAGTPRPERTWHVLDTGPVLAERGVTPVGTLLCVHGNPTWSYLWRDLVRASLEVPDGDVWRVVAVDQLEMGFSERTGTRRPLRRRVRDLGDLTDALVLDGPVVAVGHDWGGVVALGWAVDHRDLLSGVVLHDTAVHHPGGEPIPAPLRLALRLLGPSTVSTPAFLETTLGLARPPLAPEVRDAYRAPYATADRRGGIGGFVADIPATPDHPSIPELDRVAEGARRLDVPALLLWGPKDPVFGDRYLDDLADRLPHADVHRFEGAGHLLAEDVDHAAATLLWLADRRDLVTRAQPMAFGEQPLGLAPEEAVGRPAHSAGSVPSEPREGAATPPADDVADVRDQASEPPGPRCAGGEPARPGEPSPAADASHRPVVARAHLDHLAGESAVAPLAADGARRPPLWARLDDLADSPDTALVEMAPSSGSVPRVVTWRLLSRRVRQLAAGLHRSGVRPGDRVALLVPPGADLTAVLYACLRIGAVVVVADAGLGLRGLTRAVRGAWPRHVIGAVPGLTAARTLGWPGRRISASPLAAPLAATLGVDQCLADLVELGADGELPPEPAPDDPAAILFTSGSTGPAKGVVYTHDQLAAVRDALAGQYDIGVGTGLVAGFAPFALLGPALGTRSVTPDMDVTSPRTLTAVAVAEAAAAAEATVMFLSPAAIANVVATAGDLTDDHRAALAGVRTVLSAGAPVPERLLARLTDLVPSATAHTPYGMTEGLLLTDITLEGIRDAVADEGPRGVCVGRPASGVRVLVDPLDDDGAPRGEPADASGVTGELVVSAPHVKDRYWRLWLTDRAARRGVPQGRWHRTGDVGHLDASGRVWVEGRLAHVVVTADGVVTPVGPEQRIESVPAVGRAAVVGVGPRGTQQLVAVVETVPAAGSAGLAEAGLVDAVRRASLHALAAVLVVPELPTDVRHNSKIDRTRLAAWAERVLAGGRMGTP